jgi:eukaryotic-like serine/threonine-protein kinase
MLYFEPAMTGPEWQRVKQVASAALEYPADARPAFIAAECGDNEELRTEVESLLRNIDDASDLFERPVLSFVASSPGLGELVDVGPVAVGAHIGPYQVVRELGRGGMGAAYLAARADAEYEKLVAIKLIKRGMDTDAILRRFRTERQILANLNHPNIAMLLDGGSTYEGLPYFVMEYVDGLPIDVYCDAHNLPVGERLKLIQSVCAAVHHAHEHRVVHRDLKPLNILVTSRGIPKLLDFGIAKLLDPQQGLHTTADLVGHAMTPLYASPEQIRGEPVTVASDVHALGVLMYVLLAGQHPYGAEHRSALDVQRAVCEQIPNKPSAVLTDQASRLRALSPYDLRRTLAGNLDAIVLNALRKQPQDRYATAKELADDIQRHLDAEPIAARPEPLGTRVLRRFRSERARPLVAAVALTVVVLGAIAVARLARSNAHVTEITSVAVMPFVDRAATGSELDYLSDGVTENVINRLSRVARLKVIGRDSAYRYKGKAIDPQRVGRELGVQAILTGTVEQRGDEVVLGVELVDARDRTRLWGESYRRTLNDLQFVQLEIAQQIANSLRLQLSGDEQARFTRRDSGNAEAYQLYMKGRYFWNKRTPGDFRKSIAYLQQAIDREPSLVLAHAGLADSFGLLTEYHAAPARETYAQAKRAATRALAIDDESAEAHTSLGYIRQFYEWDWPAAEAEYRRAIDLNPNYATAHQWYAEFLSSMGRHDEAIKEIRRAAAVDPLSHIVNSVEANLLYMGRRYDEAIAKLRQVVEMEPAFAEAYEYLKRSYDQKGMYREAIDNRQTRRRILGLDITETLALRAAASATTPREYWRRRLEQELIEGKTEGLQSFEMAEMTGQAGDISHALDWLEKACAENDFMITYIKVAPNLDPLRNEPRFQALLKQSCGVQVQDVSSR